MSSHKATQIKKQEEFMLKRLVVLLISVFVVSGCISTRSARKDNPVSRMAGIVMGRPLCH